MNIIAVDDERLACQSLVRAIKTVAPEAEVSDFRHPDEAIAYAMKNQVDVAFLDIEMSNIDGLSLAKSLKDIYGQTNIIFVTGHSIYSTEAFKLRASGYVLKPIEPEQVKLELENLRSPVLLKGDEEKGVRVQCFGNFEVFVDGSPVKFMRAKSKEALAYLIDRNGSTVTKKELAAVLMENEEYSRAMQSYIHNIISDMILSLEQRGAANIVIKNRNAYSVDKTKFSCDYYEYRTGNLISVNSYHGEYMSNYSWGEFRIGEIT